MLNLDLVVFDRMNGRGAPIGSLADVPRRSLLVEAVAALTGLVSGVVLVRLLMVGVIAVAFVGAARALRAHPWPIAVGAALFFAVNPFLLTRLGVGHIGLAIATALLPWAAPTLLHPSTAPRRTFLWLVAFGAAGYLAATVALPLVVIGLVADRGRRLLAVVSAIVVSQLPWLLPAILNVAGSGPAATSRSFRPDLDTVERVLRLTTGGGFWQAENQVGGTGLGPTLVAVSMIALAQVGQLVGRQPPDRRLAVAGLIGLAATLLPSVPVFDDIAARLTSFPTLAPWRESQRLLAPFVWWVTAAAATGVDALVRARTAQRRARLDLLAGAALAVATATVVGGAWWGLGGRVSAPRTAGRLARPRPLRFRRGECRHPAMGAVLRPGAGRRAADAHASPVSDGHGRDLLARPRARGRRRRRSGRPGGRGRPPARGATRRARGWARRARRAVGGDRRAGRPG